MTDDRGEYRIAGLHPGKYYVVAEYKSKPLVTLNSIIENVNALQKMTDKKGRPFELICPGFPILPTLMRRCFIRPRRLSAGASLKLNPGDEMAADFLLISAPVVSIRGKVTNGMTGQTANSASVAAFWTTYIEGDGIPGLVSAGWII